MEQVLVTGANGFIGRATASKLAREGRRVLGTDFAMGSETEFQVILVDLSDRNSLMALMKDNRITAFIHCGGVSGPMLARDNPALICRVNIGGTINVLECARTLDISRIVFCSSCGVYGNTGPALVSEDAPFAATDVYGVSKSAGDMLVRSYARASGDQLNPYPAASK